MSDAYFLNPEGQVIAVDPAQASLVAGAKGYLPASPEQIADYQAAEKYGGTGQRVIAGAEGLARGLTGRLSTAAEVGLGVDPEGIAGRMAAHPGTAAVSEATGIALPLLATLGTEAPVAGGLRTAAELTAPSLIAKAGQAAGSRIVGGAVEGALYGVGNVVHEAALGDPDLTAQAALAHVGLSAAMGGAIGGVLHAGETGLKAALGRARESAGRLAEGLATPEKLKALAQEQHDATEGAARLAFREIRPAEVAELTSAMDPNAAYVEAQRLADRMTEVAGNMRAQPELFPHAMFPAKLEQIAEAVRRDAPLTNAGAAFTVLNDAKVTIDKQLGKWGKLISPEQQDAVAAIRGVRTELKTALENESLWGEAGARQATFNEAFGEYQAALKDFRKEFAIRKQGKGINPDFEIDAGKLHRLSDTGNPRQPIRQEIWDNYQNASKRLIDEIEASRANAPVASFDKQALEGLINKTGEMEQANRQQGTVLRMLGRMGGVGPMGTMAGALVGGPMGAAIGAGVDLVAKGAKYIPAAVDTLTRLHANNEAMSKAIGAAAARFASGSEKAARIGREEVSAGIGRYFGMDSGEATAHFEKHADKIRSFTSNPDSMQSALEGLTADIHEHAPQTAQALSVTAARAMAFLTSKIPPTVKPGPLAEALPLSQSQIATYNRYREAVEHPESLLRQAAAGTLTKEAVEAVQAVYPKLLQQIRGAVVEKLTPDSPYRVRLMAAMLLGRDLDGTMSGQAILREQMRYVKPPMPQPTKSGAAKLKTSQRTQTNAQRAAAGDR